MASSKLKSTLVLAVLINLASAATLALAHDEALTPHGAGLLFRIDYKVHGVRDMSNSEHCLFPSVTEYKANIDSLLLQKEEEEKAKIAFTCHKVYRVWQSSVIPGTSCTKQWHVLDYCEDRPELEQEILFLKMKCLEKPIPFCQDPKFIQAVGSLRLPEVINANEPKD